MGTLHIRRYIKNRRGGVKESKLAKFRSERSDTLQKVRDNYIHFARIRSKEIKDSICLEFDDEPAIVIEKGEVVEG